MFLVCELCSRVELSWLVAAAADELSEERCARVERRLSYELRYQTSLSRSSNAKTVLFQKIAHIPGRTVLLVHLLAVPYYSTLQRATYPFLADVRPPTLEFVCTDFVCMNNVHEYMSLSGPVFLLLDFSTNMAIFVKYCMCPVESF